MSLEVILYNLKNLENVINVQRGDNPSGITVVYEESSETKESQNFLEKVFSAVSVDFNNLDKLIVKNDQPTSLVQWDGWPDTQMVLFFGIQPARLGIHYELQAFIPQTVQGKKFLYCADLIDIQAKPAHKEALWAALQNMFKINE